MANNKQRLFEVMERLDNTFKVEQVQPQSQVDTPVPADIANLQKVSKNSPAMQKANARIDTPIEFQQGFKTWMASTGFHPQTKKITITQVQTLVKRAMEELGFK